MKPEDLTNQPFEVKIKAAADLRGIPTLNAEETAALKSRIRFVLFNSNPAELSVAQLATWIDRVLPAIRRSNAVIAAHDAIPVQADAQQAHEVVAAGEVVCSLVGERPVRFNPANMVVTPFRVDQES